MRIGLAFRAFFAALFNRQAAGAVEAALSGRALPAPSADAAKKDDEEAARREAAERARQEKAAKASSAAVGGEALALVAALQREARLVDIVKEPLGQYTDAQIGAAARDVLRDCGQVLERIFAIRPLEEKEEGAAVEVPAGFDATRFRLTGNVQGEPPFRGSLVHHGWQATKCEVPKWTGSEAASRIVSPAEVELQ